MVEILKFFFKNYWSWQFLIRRKTFNIIFCLRNIKKFRNALGRERNQKRTQTHFKKSNFGINKTKSCKRKTFSIFHVKENFPVFSGSIFFYKIPLKTAIFIMFKGKTTAISLCLENIVHINMKCYSSRRKSFTFFNEFGKCIQEFENWVLRE